MGVVPHTPASDSPQAENAKKLAWLATFPELNPNPIVEWDSHTGSVHYANPAASRLFPDLAARGLEHPFLADLQELALSMAAQSEVVHRREIMVGTSHYFQSISLVQDHGMLRIYSADISERKRAEEAQMRLAEIVNSSPDAIIGMALDGTITSWSTGAAQIFGFSAREVLGSPLPLPVPPEHEAREHSVRARVANGARVEQFETARILRDGRRVEISASVSPIRDSAGALAGLAIIARDITGRRTQEELLRASLKEVNDLKAALDEHAIVAITDPRGRITYVNDKFCAISRFSREELLGQDHRIINSGYHSKEFIRDIWDTISHGRVWKGEIQNKAKDGSFYWVDTTIVPFLNEQGRPWQYVAIRADITARKLAEAKAEEFTTAKLALQASELRRANEALERSNVELQQFAYIASHDLQTPLRNISGFVQLLQLNYADKLGNEGADWIRRTASACEYMHTLIRDVLAYSRVDSKASPFQAIPLAEVFNDAAAALESTIHELGGSVSCGELPVVMGDRSQLVQLLQNLIGNGLKYHGVEPPRVQVTSVREEHEWVVSVSDNGIGISPRHHDRIFEIFRRLHNQQEYPGTGIGLAICRRVVLRHGGRIWVESGPGRGSTFCFTIPAAPALQYEHQASQNPPG